MRSQSGTDEVRCSDIHREMSVGLTEKEDLLLSNHRAWINDGMKLEDMGIMNIETGKSVEERY